MSQRERREGEREEIELREERESFRLPSYGDWCDMKTEFPLSNNRLNQPFYCFSIKLCGFFSCWLSISFFISFWCTRCDNSTAVIRIRNANLKAQKDQKAPSSIEQKILNNVQLEAERFFHNNFWLFLVFVYRISAWQRQQIYKKIEKDTRRKSTFYARNVKYAHGARAILGFGLAFLSRPYKRTQYTDYKKMHNFLYMPAWLKPCHRIATKQLEREPEREGKKVYTLWCVCVGYSIQNAIRNSLYEQFSASKQFAAAISRDIFCRLIRLIHSVTFFYFLYLTFCCWVAKYFVLSNSSGLQCHCMFPFTFILLLCLLARR